MGNEYKTRIDEEDINVNTDVTLAPPRPPRRKRGRKPRSIVAIDDAGKPIYFTSLEIQMERHDAVEILRLVGKLETESLLLLRDHAFTSIGSRPQELCLDLDRVVLPLDRQAMETLLTIGRVARLVNVRYSVILPPALESVWHSAGLNRLIAIRRGPVYKASVVVPILAAAHAGSAAN